MGFTCGIYRIKKMSFGSLTEPDNLKTYNALCSYFSGAPIESKVFDESAPYVEEAKANLVADEFGYKHLWTLVEDWCSSGRYWFDKMSNYLKPVENECGSETYIFTKDTYKDLVAFASTLLEELKFEDGWPAYGLVRLESSEDDEDAGWTARPIDGCEFEFEDRKTRRVWSDGDVWDTDPVVMLSESVDVDRFYSYLDFIKAVMSLASIDWDNEEVEISGGW